MQTVLHGVIVFTKGEIQFSILLLTYLCSVCVVPSLAPSKCQNQISDNCHVMKLFVSVSIC